MQLKEALRRLYEDEEGCYECNSVTIGVTGAGHVVLQLEDIIFELGHSEDPHIDTPNKLIKRLSFALKAFSKARTGNWRRTRSILV